MCLTVINPETHGYVRFGDRCEPMVANHNMVVFKIGYMSPRRADKHPYEDIPNLFLTVYQHFTYTQGIPAPYVDIVPTRAPYDDAMYVHRGYHAYVQPHSVIGTGYDDAGVFVIPQGSRYFLGDNNDIVSTNMVYLTSYPEWNEMNAEDRERLVATVSPAVRPNDRLAE